MQTKQDTLISRKPSRMTISEGTKNAIQLTWTTRMNFSWTGRMIPRTYGASSIIPHMTESASSKLKTRPADYRGDTPRAITRTNPGQEPKLQTEKPNSSMLGVQRERAQHLWMPQQRQETIRNVTSRWLSKQSQQGGDHFLFLNNGVQQHNTKDSHPSKWNTSTTFLQANIYSPHSWNEHLYNFEMIHISISVPGPSPVRTVKKYFTDYPYSSI